MSEAVILHALHLFVLDLFGRKQPPALPWPYPAAQPGAPLHYIMLPAQSNGRRAWFGCFGAIVSVMKMPQLPDSAGRAR